MVYIISSGFGRKGPSAETRHLKSVFGEDWRQGMRKNPHIDRHQEGYAEKAKAKMRAEKEKKVDQILSQTISEAKQKGVISEGQAQRMNNAL
jgi:hypothetical protein